MIKAIIFDVDGVMIKSNQNKRNAMKETLQQYGVYGLPGVSDILSLTTIVNRKIILRDIAKLHDFDHESALKLLNKKNSLFESNPNPNTPVLEFIKNNHEEYIFFTNTSLPGIGLDRVMNGLSIADHFKKLFSFDTGTKPENIKHIIGDYDFKPEEILFIDDNIHHIDTILSTGVRTFHFNDYDLSIEDKILEINREYEK